MIEIIDLIVFTVIFFLLFLVAGILFDPFRQWTGSFCKTHIPLLTKISRETVIKGFAVAGFILLARKLIYYIPLPGSIFLVFGIFSMVYFLGSGEWRFPVKVKTARQASSVRDMLSGDRSIKDVRLRYDSCKKLIPEIAKAGNREWAETIFQQAVETAKKIEFHDTRCEVFKQIALAMANTGDTQWAAEIAQLIEEDKIRDKTLRKIQRIIENR